MKPRRTFESVVLELVSGLEDHTITLEQSEVGCEVRPPELASGEELETILAPLYNKRIVQHQSFDADYVQRLTSSDSETERDFAAYFGELLALKLRPRLRSPDLVQDVIQETFLRVLRTLRQTGVDHPEALGSFVNSVCNNVLFEVYRAQSKVAGPPEDRASEEIPAESAMVNEEERSNVRNVLSQMPEKDRKILRWLFFDEREKGDICRSLQVDREYLRVLVHRAKSRFRADYLRRNATKAGRATPTR